MQDGVCQACVFCATLLCRRGQDAATRVEFASSATVQPLQ